MRYYLFGALMLTGACLLCMSPAHAVIEDSWNPHEPYVTTPWYVKVDEAGRKADLDYIAGMRPHHEGALSMAQDYLADPASSSGQMKTLARGIIHNQKFEIGLLGRIAAYQKPAIAQSGAEWRKIADEALVQKERFYRSPVPGPLDADNGEDVVNARDVAFAKAMIIHHQAAIDMAEDYLANKDVQNGYLSRVNLDIIVDQTQDIKLMRDLIGRYAGNPDKIVITADMVDGMESMKHHLAMLIENQNALTNPDYKGQKQQMPADDARPAHGGHHAM